MSTIARKTGPVGVVSQFEFPGGGQIDLKMSRFVVATAVNVAAVLTAFFSLGERP